MKLIAVGVKNNGKSFSRTFYVAAQVVHAEAEKISNRFKLARFKF